MLAIERRKIYGPPVLGLNTRFSPGTLNDQEAVTLNNYQVNNDGSLEKIPGYTLDASPFPASASSFIRTIFNFRSGTLNQLLVAASDAGNANTTFQVDIKETIGDGNYSYITFGIGTAAFTHSNTSVTGTNTSWTTELKVGDKIKLGSDVDAKYTEIATVNSDTSLTLVAGGYLGTTGSGAYNARKIWNVGNIPAMCSFNNVAIITNGTDLPQQYDGTNIFNLINSYVGTVVTTQPNAAPKGDYVIKHKNRVFMLKQNGNLYWSHAFDQTFWDPASFVAVFAQDGGTAVGMSSFADSIFIFKNNGNVYRIFGNFDDSAIGTPAYLQRVDYSEKIGIISSRSITIHGNLLYFIAQTGVYTIDQRGFMQKISYIIDPTTQAYNFGLAGTIQKSYPFTTTAQWNTGTHNGTFSTASNQILQTFFDDIRVTDAQQSYNLCSIAIGSNNTLHVAYVPASNLQQINYIRYRPSGSTLGGSATLKETNILQTLENNVTSVSIAVSNVDETVGISFTTATFSLFYVERTPDTQSPFAYGTWSGVVNVNGGPFGKAPQVSSLIFTSGGTPMLGLITGTGSSQVFFASKTAGVWTVTGIVTYGSSIPSAQLLKIAIAVDGSSNIYISVLAQAQTTVNVYKSTNSGVTWSNYDSWTVSNSVDQRSALSVGFNHANDFLTVLSDQTGAILKRDHTTTTSTTIETISGYLAGWFPIYNTLDAINKDTDNYLKILVSSSTQEVVKSNYNASASIGTDLTNPTTNVVTETSNGTLHPGMQPYLNNGYVVASINFGVNSNEIVIKRMSPYGYWQGPEQSDAGLTAWGTYDVTGATGGATFKYEIALASSHPASNFVTITPGSIISSNAALIFNIPRIIFTLTQWGSSSITTLVLNYTGAGVDAKQIFGISFFNEAYFAACPSGHSNNDTVLVQDIKNAFITNSYPVNCMESFNNKLYAGSSLQGDVYILKQGFSFNGSAYTATFVSKEDFLEYMELQKSFHKAYVLYSLPNGGQFNFDFRIDNFISGNAAWQSTTVVPNNTGIQEINIKQKGRSIEFRTVDSQNNQQSGIFGIVLIYGLLNLR